MIDLDSLHHGHERILALIALVEAVGIFNANGRALLESLEQALLEHLREEEHGHVQFWQLSQGNGMLAQKVQRSHEGLVEIAVATVVFFHRLHQPGSSAGVETAFRVFKKELRTRIEQEEQEMPRLIALLEVHRPEMAEATGRFLVSNGERVEAWGERIV